MGLGNKIAIVYRSGDDNMVLCRKSLDLGIGGTDTCIIQLAE